MKHLMTFNEKMVLKNYDSYVKLVAKAYKEAPDFEQSEKYRWDILNKSNYTFFKRLISKVEVIFVTTDKSLLDTKIEILGKNYKVQFMANDPYSSQKEMKKSVEESKVLYISMDYSNHPVFSVTDNIVFRAVHDYIVHILANVDFSGKGEIAAFNAHAKLAPNETIPAIFTEVCGQACHFVAYGEFPKQKITVLKGFDYTNVGAVDGYDIVNKELVKSERVLEYRDYLTDSIEEYIGDKFGKKLTLFGDNQPYDGYLFEFDAKRVLKVEGEGYGHQHQMMLYEYLKEHGSKLPIARVYDTGRIDVPLRYFEVDYAERSKDKNKKNYSRMTYILMEKVYETKHVTDVLMDIYYSENRFYEYIGSSEKNPHPNMINRLSVFVKTNNNDMLEKAMEFFKQDEKVNEKKDSIEYAERLIYIFQELEKHDIDWADIHAGQFGLNHKGDLVAFDIDNYYGKNTPEYSMKNNIKESFK